MKSLSRPDANDMETCMISPFLVWATCLQPVPIVFHIHHVCWFFWLVLSFVLIVVLSSSSGSPVQFIEDVQLNPPPARRCALTFHHLLAAHFVVNFWNKQNHRSLVCMTFAFFSRSESLLCTWTCVGVRSLKNSVFLLYRVHQKYQFFEHTLNTVESHLQLLVSSRTPFSAFIQSRDNPTKYWRSFQFCSQAPDEAGIVFVLSDAATTRNLKVVSQ